MKQLLLLNMYDIGVLCVDNTYAYVLWAYCVKDKV